MLEAITTETKRIVGRMCSVSLGSALAEWTKYSIQLSITSKECKAAQSGIMQRVVIHADAKASLEGYRGGDETFALLARIGKDVLFSATDFTAQEAALFAKWRIKDKSMDQADEPGTYKLEIEAGYIDNYTPMSPAAGPPPPPAGGGA